MEHVPNNDSTLQITSLQSPLLQHCWSVVFKDFPLIGASLLDTPAKCEAILSFIDGISSSLKKRHQPLRLSVIQPGLVGIEWEQLQAQHASLVKVANDKGIEVAHLCHPTEAFYLANDPEQFSEFAQKSLNRLLHDFNTEALIQYIAWLNEESEKLLAGFEPEASEEYQLQARLEDLSHEVHSTMLKSVRVSLDELAISREKASSNGSPEALLELEKKLIIHREQLGQMLGVQRQLLHDIIQGVGKIEEMHPELSPLRNKSQLLHQFIRCNQESPGSEGWGKWLLLMQSLDESFGVISLVSCDAYPERIAFTIAVRVAFSQLSEEFSNAQLLALFKDHHLQRHLASKVVANLLLFRGFIKPQAQESKWGINKDFLPFVPHALKTNAIELFARNEAGQKLDLTPEGKRYFHHLGVIP